jgi:hypothetical protein
MASLFAIIFVFYCCIEIVVAQCSSEPCPASVGNFGIFYGAGVNLADQSLGKVAPIGTCDVTSEGGISYYDGTNTNNPAIPSAPYGAGLWNRDGCTSPCICSDTACYFPQTDPPEPDSQEPVLDLYPYCSSPNDCFIAAIISSSGLLVNINDPSDVYSSDDQIDPVTLDKKPVTGSSYLKATHVSCTGCSTPSALPSPTVTVCPTTPPTTLPPCPPEGEWSEWSTPACSDTCGLCGVMTSTRTCLSESNGCPCIGDSTQTGARCNENVCPWPRASCCTQYSRRALINGKFICIPI